VDSQSSTIRKAATPAQKRQPVRQFRAELIETLEEWQGIAESWDSLLRATESYTALQSFDFLSTWWGSFSDGRRLFIVTFLEEDDIVGIAPFQLLERRILGKTYRVLQFIGMTEDILRPTVLFPSAKRSDLLGALNQFLIEQRQRWDIVELDELESEDSLLESLKNLARELGLLYEQMAFHPCPFIDLQSESSTIFWSKRSPKLRKNVRASERKLAQLGAVEVELYDSAADIVNGFDKFLSVAEHSWKQQAKLGIAADRRYESFYRELLQSFARKHGACVLVLSTAGHPIAATFAVLFDRTYNSMQIVHDEAYARYSPGTLLEAKELEALLERNHIWRYEFMGGALSNKVRWTEQAIATVCVGLTPRDPVHGALRLYKTMKAVAKRVYKRARSSTGAF
jgi:CelD/BcsL family acetyltransferase involved in cellulose biosynthesis